MTPTQLTLRKLRDMGYRAAVVERWNPHAQVRQDLFGMFDVVAVRAGNAGVLAVQCTAKSGRASRAKKLADDPDGTLRVWLVAGNRCEVWGWERAIRWHLTSCEMVVAGGRVVAGVWRART